VALADCAASSGDAISKQVALLERAKAVNDCPSLAVRLRVVSVGRLSVWARRQRAYSADAAVDRYFAMMLWSQRLEHVVGKADPDHVSEVLEVLEVLKKDLAGIIGHAAADARRLEMIHDAIAAKQGSDSLDAAQWLALLAEVYGQQGHFASKRKTLEHVLRIQERAFGLDAVFLVRTLRLLAQAAGQLNDLPARRDYLRRALAILLEELGAQHPETASCQRSLVETTEQLRLSRDPEGSLELGGLFPRCAQPAPSNEQAPKFLVSFDSYGGGSCAPISTTGLQVPHYAALSLLAG